MKNPLNRRETKRRNENNGNKKKEKRWRHVLVEAIAIVGNIHRWETTDSVEITGTENMSALRVPLVF